MGNNESNDVSYISNYFDKKKITRDDYILKKLLINADHMPTVVNTSKNLYDFKVCL